MPTWEAERFMRGPRALTSDGRNTVSSGGRMGGNGSNKQRVWLSDVRLWAVLPGNTRKRVRTLIDCWLDGKAVSSDVSYGQARQSSRLLEIFCRCQPTSRWGRYGPLRTKHHGGSGRAGILISRDCDGAASLENTKRRPSLAMNAHEIPSSSTASSSFKP